MYESVQIDHPTKNPFVFCFSRLYLCWQFHEYLAVYSLRNKNAIHLTEVLGYMHHYVCPSIKSLYSVSQFPFSFFENGFLARFFFIGNHPIHYKSMSYISFFYLQFSAGLPPVIIFWISTFSVTIRKNTIS